MAESSESKKKWIERHDIIKSMRTLRHEVATERSLAAVDKITEHRNKGGLFLPPVALLPFTTRARLLISKLVNVTTIYSDVLINATNVINSDTELANLWNMWYNGFNPHEKVHGPEICRAILSKLINSAFGVVLKEVNARYTNLGTNNKTKLALRATLKATSTNSGGTTGGNTRGLRPFNDAIDGLDTVPQQSSGGGGGGGGGGPVDEELKDDMLDEFENKLFYAEDEFNKDLADAEDTDQGDDEEDDRDPDVWEVIEVEQKSDGPTRGNNEDGLEEFSMAIESSSMFQDGNNCSSSSSSSSSSSGGGRPMDEELKDDMLEEFADDTSSTRNIANIGEEHSSNGKKQCSECQKWVHRLNRHLKNVHKYIK